jgi:hypothetical protein
VSRTVGLGSGSDTDKDPTQVPVAVFLHFVIKPRRQGQRRDQGSKASTTVGGGETNSGEK